MCCCQEHFALITDIDALNRVYVRLCYYGKASGGVRVKKFRKKGVFAKTLPYFKNYMWGFWVGIVLSLLSTVAMLLMPQIPQLIIDRIINPALGEKAVYSDSNVFSFLLDGYAEDDYFGMLKVMLICMAVVCLVKYVTHYARWNLTHNMMMRGENKVRDYAFYKMLRQSPVVLNRYTSGDMLNVTNNDPSAIKDLYLHHIPFLMGSVFSIIISLYFLLLINPLLVLVPIVTGCITAVIVRGYNKILQKKYNKIRQGNVELSTYIQENINGVRIIRCFATEADETKRFEKRNAAFRDNYVDLARTSAKYSMIFTFLGETVSIMSIILGIFLSVKGNLSVGEFATFTSYCFTINSNIVFMAGQIGNIQNSVVCAKRYFEFADRPEAVVDKENPLPVPEKPTISFKNVSMSFDDGQKALDQINLEIPYGRRVGIMGKTGSGKSVLMKLMTRLYDCTEGEILLDGVNIKDMSVDEVRRKYSFVMQDVFLFSESVANNIALYDEDASDEKVVHCAQMACADNFATKLADGYDTIVGERGLGLSGGQKQRVSIARALLKDAPVILLDDCTSALDYETEKEITANLFKNYGDRTMIVASHRAGSVAYCDEIIYLEDGKIVERGTHEELIAMKGRYYDIFTEQESLREEEIN